MTETMDDLNPFDGIPIGDFSANNTETCQYLATTSTTLVVVPKDDGQQYDDQQNEQEALLIPARSLMELIPKNNDITGWSTFNVEMIKK